MLTPQVKKFYNITRHLSNGYWRSYWEFEEDLLEMGYHKQTIKTHFFSCIKHNLMRYSPKKGWLRIVRNEEVKTKYIEISNHKEYFKNLLEKRLRVILRRMNYMRLKKKGKGGSMYQVSVLHLAKLMGVSVRTIYRAKKALIEDNILRRRSRGWHYKGKKMYCDLLQMVYVRPSLSSWGKALENRQGWWDH